MSSLSPVGRSAAARKVDRFAVTPKNDRVSLCSFTFSDGRRCRAPRVAKHPRFCFYHAQKEARAHAAKKLGKDLTYFFSGDYLSACDLSTAMARLIPAVVRGDVKPKTAHTVAYLVQTLMQAIHISQHEYINAFGTDGWRKSVRNSVNDNHAYRFPPDPEPEQPPDQAPHVVAGLQTGGSQAPHPAPATQPAQTPVNCHSSLATHHSPLPHAPQPAPSPHTSLPPTGAEFVRHVVAGLQTGGSQAPQPAPASSPTSPSASPSIPPQPAASTTAKGHPIPATQLPRPVAPAQPNNPPPAASPTPKPVLPLDSRALHFDHNCRLRIDGKLV